jgi:IS5 family transposase
MEDLSDPELAWYLKENLAAKWLCGFTLSEPRPDYSLFSLVRTRIWPTRLSQRFATMRAHLKTACLISEGFTFVDTTHLITKATLWEERDKARQQKLEQLNTDVLSKVINKGATTPTNLPDAHGRRQVCPPRGDRWG